MGEESKKEEQKTEKSEQAESTEEPVEEIEEAAETLEEEEEAAEALEEEVEIKEELPPVEEKVKRPSRQEIEEEIVEERFCTIPLGKAWIAPPNKRAPRAIRLIKDFVKRHMKLEARVEGIEEEEPKRLIISNKVNERVWKRSIQKPPRKIRVRAAKDKDGNVTVYLAEGD